MNFKKTVIFVFFFCSCIFLCSCKNNNKIFTKPEYIKEVITQKSDFDDIIENFLDQVDTYTGTSESNDKINKLFNQAEIFVNNLKEKFSPKVPETSKSHYNNMIISYNLYLEAMKIYKNALPKELSPARNEEIKSAETKFHEADLAMKNLKQD